MQSRTGSVLSRPSDSVARSVKLRERLRRSGAMVSSRSALSRQDATSEDFLVVDVGPGKTPTVVEQFIARLEQHGLRRCLVTESDLAEHNVAPFVDITRDATAPVAADDHEDAPSSTRSGSHEPEVRSPYYYLCVPCELRLTNVSVESATQAMLEDMHYHFASAVHREAASWMADPDIDETLSSSPLVEDPHAYTRIYVNGIPAMLSRRPGGGDMFYPLPHEVERVSVRKIVRRAPVPAALEGGSAADACHERNHGEGTQEADSKGMIFPSPRYSSDVTYWYRPLSAIDTRSKQLVSHVPRGLLMEAKESKYVSVREGAARRAVRVDHVPVAEYLAHTHLDKDKATIHPCLFALTAQRLPKGLVKRRRQDSETGEMPRTTGRRCYYVQPRVPYVSAAAAPRHESRDADSNNNNNSWCDRCLVESNGVYRVVLLSRADLEEQEALRDAARRRGQDNTLGQTAAPPSQPVLTRELLSQVSTYTPFEQYYSAGTSTGSHDDAISPRGRSASLSSMDDDDDDDDSGRSLSPGDPVSK